MIVVTTGEAWELETVAWIAAIIVQRDLPHHDNVTLHVNQCQAQVPRTPTCLLFGRCGHALAFGSYVALGCSFATVTSLHKLWMASPEHLKHGGAVSLSTLC